MKNLELKTLYGFEFVKAGVFYLAETSWKITSKGWEIRASLELVSEKFRKADETVYLVYSDDDLVYVGEYTYNLESRWLSGNYVDHHKSDDIERQLEAGCDVTLWLAVFPYTSVDRSLQAINISKSIEHELLKKCDPKWNKRNKRSASEKWRQKNCISVVDIVKNDID